MYTTVMMSFICKLAHDVSWQLAAKSLFPWMTAGNTVTNSRLDSRVDQIFAEVIAYIKVKQFHNKQDQ